MEHWLTKKTKEILRYVESEELYPKMRKIDVNDPETIVDGKRVLLFCSLNYLGLANHPDVKKAAIEAIKKYGVGAGSLRFVSGNFGFHEILEKKIAELKIVIYKHCDINDLEMKLKKYKNREKLIITDSVLVWMEILLLSLRL